MSWVRFQQQHSPVWELWGPRKLHLSCLYDPPGSVKELLEQLNIPANHLRGQKEMKRAIPARALALPHSKPASPWWKQSSRHPAVLMHSLCAHHGYREHSQRNQYCPPNSCSKGNGRLNRATSCLLFQTLEGIEILKATLQGFQYIQ